MVLTQTNTYNSSTVKSSAYNYEHKTLMVHFDHASYLYNQVSLDDYERFANAGSQGRALSQYIKGKYEFEKINETKQQETV